MASSEERELAHTMGELAEVSDELEEIIRKQHRPVSRAFGQGASIEQLAAVPGASAATISQRVKVQKHR